MIISVEPFGHFHSNNIVAIALNAVSHSKIQLYKIVFQSVVTFGNSTEGESLVEHLVVKRKII